MCLDEDPRTPGSRAPSRGEKEDVYANECNHGSDSGGVGSVGDTDDSDDEFTDEHSQGPPNQQRATSEPLDGVEGDGSRADVDQGCNKADEEGVRDGPELLEEGGSKVKDEVDTSPLLHHLQRGAQNGSAHIAATLEQGAFEAVGPAAQVTGLRNDLHFVLVVRHDFGQFLLDVLGVPWLSAESCEDVHSSLDLALLHKISWGLGEEDESGSEDQSPQHLETDRDAVRARVGVVLRTIIHARGDQKTKGDAELVAGDYGTTHLSRGNLGHVQDDDSRDEPDTKSGDQTACHQETQGGGSGLEDDTDDENDAPNNDGGPTSDPVSHVSADQGAEESPGREDGCDERLLPRGESEVTVRDPGRGRLQAGVEGDEVIHALDTADIPGIVAEENATNGREGAHEVGLYGDGGLDAVDIGRRSQGDGSSRHDGGVCITAAG